jgi:hypothetical protein
MAFSSLAPFKIESLLEGQYQQLWQGREAERKQAGETDCWEDGIF